MNGEDPYKRMNRYLEKLFGYPPGAFDPLTPFHRDAERLNKALGEGFKLFQEVFTPQRLKERIETLHLDGVSKRRD